MCLYLSPFSYWAPDIFNLCLRIANINMQMGGMPHGARHSLKKGHERGQQNSNGTAFSMAFVIFIILSLMGLVIYT